MQKPLKIIAGLDLHSVGLSKILLDSPRKRNAILKFIDFDKTHLWHAEPSIIC